MDFVNGNIRKIYFRYLAAAFGSAMITSVYSIVDMAMVGQYQGPDGTATVIGSVVSFVVMLTHYFLSGNFAAQGVLCGVGLCGVEHPQVHQSTPGTLSIKIPRSFQSSYSVCSGVS